MICHRCFGNGVLSIRDPGGRRAGVRVCPECQGCGRGYCCSGDRAEPEAEHEGEGPSDG